MDFRNARYNKFGTIDCDIKHPKWGWIPFTASPDDIEDFGKELHAQLLKGEVAEYVAPEPVIVIPNRVSARKFKMQLHISGLLTTVEAWVATQDKLVQISYADSESFVREEPMMQAGFAALGFQTAQINAFFIAADAL